MDADHGDMAIEEHPPYSLLDGLRELRAAWRRRTAARRRRRFERLDHQTRDLRDALTHNHDHSSPWWLVEVTGIYQPAKRGTKAWVAILDVGGPYDSWFWHYRPARGALLLIEASSGWGPHHSRDILYVGMQGHRHGIVRSFPKRDLQRLRRLNQLRGRHL